MNEDLELTHISTFPPSKDARHENILVLNSKRPNYTQNRTQEPFLRYIQTLNHRIPKNIITFDEKYLRSCLELVYASAMKGTSCSSIFENSSFGIRSFSEGTHSLNFKSGLSETKNCNINILNNPLFHQSVSIENGIAHGRDNVSTSSRLSISSLPEPEKKMMVSENEKFKFENKHKRHVSVPSTCTLSGRSSFSFFGNLNRGMLHFTWKDGLPHFVFSLDNHNEIYIANIIKSESPINDGFDYIYTFHTNEAYLAGKMRVSTSLKLCPNNSEIKETEFVLFGEDERKSEEVQTLISHNSKKGKGFSKVFKTTSSRYVSTNERPLLDFSTKFLPNLELAAIIVKNHICVNHQEPDVGGWGMKFLKKFESKNTTLAIDTLSSPCNCFANNEDCPTSTKIVIPAGFHGGPWNSIGGVSSLVERWRCERKCDCGGWDIGCPITVLDTERKKGGNLSEIDIQGAGLQDSAPVMNMVNIRDGLYVIHFQSKLSALQSLSIAVSIIHNQNVQ